MLVAWPVRHAFASDHLALASTNRALARGLDQAVPAAWRLFFYLPLEHSEVLADQQRGLDLLLALPPVEGLPGDGHMTRLHCEIIERFGRFPHRNAILGRESTEEELAFYDALETNDSAVKVLGDETLRTIARELVDTVRRNTSIDWTLKEAVKAKLSGPFGK